MSATANRPLRVGDWHVDPALGEIARDGERLRLDGRNMRLLLHLAGHAGEVVSVDELLDAVWRGVIVTPDSVYQAVTSLRRVLGDNAKDPAYIATVPRLGYRMVARVEPWRDTPQAVAPDASRRRPRWAGIAAAALIAVAGAGSWMAFAPGRAVHAVAPAPPSIAVLPLLDLTTQAMDEKYFADGLTEEIIDRLGALPGAHVPGATASFYYKDKSLPVADIALALGVAYVLDGSVRKSDNTFRIAVRALRASDGGVIWTHSYERPIGDVVAIQKDVAGEIARALPSALNAASAAPDDAR